jgi:dynein heavy chain
MKTLVFDPVKNPAIEIPRVSGAMLSKDDERVPFQTNFECVGAVESWLSALEYKMRECLEDILDQAKTTAEMWDSGDRPREDWVKDYCAQIALLTT